MRSLKLHQLQNEKKKKLYSQVSPGITRLMGTAAHYVEPCQSAEELFRRQIDFNISLSISRKKKTKQAQ